MCRVRSLETTLDASIARRHARTIRRKRRTYRRALRWLTRRAVLSGVAGGKVERTDVVTTPRDAQPSLLSGPQEAAVFDVEPFVASSSPSSVVTAASAFAFLSAPKPIRRRSSAFSPCRA